MANYPNRHFQNYVAGDKFDGDKVEGNKIETQINVNLNISETFQKIDNPAKSKSKFISSLKAGGTSALDSLLDHLAASFVIGAIENWRNSQD